MTVSWHSFDLRSGRRGARVETSSLGTVSRIIGESTGTDLDVQCVVNGKTPLDFEAATLPGRTMVVAIDEADSERIIWGGIVVRRTATAAPTVKVSALTAEHYLARRFVPDLTFTAVDQASIAASVIATASVEGIGLTVDAPASGVVRDRAYLDDDDKTVLSVLQELKDVQDGAEFTVDLEWADDSHMLLRKVIRVRNRIGSSPLYPTRWSMPGCITDFEYVEDYTEQFGANDIVATSSGEGDVRPESAHQKATDLIVGGWARFEERFTPSTSITDVSTLNAHARERLGYRRNGLRQLSLTARTSEAPRLNIDWWLGDDIAVDLTAPRFPARRGPDGDLQPGFTQICRVVGWESDLAANTLTPTVWQPGDSS